MSVSSYGTGRYVAVEADVYFKPRIPSQQVRYSIIYCHGSLGRATSALGVDGTGQPKLISQLCDRGYDILVCDLGSIPVSNWGNTEAMSRIDSAFTYATTTLGFRASKIHLLGFSMGNVVALRWAFLNTSKVASIAAVIPAYDMEAIRLNASSSPANDTLRTQIDAAWGVTYPAALPAQANPPDLTATIAAASIPFQCWYSSDDVPEFVSGATACATALNGTAISLGALGHTDAAIGSVPVPALAAFFATYD